MCSFKRHYNQNYNKNTVYFIKISHTTFAKRCSNYKTIIILKAVTLRYLKQEWH